ncbi:uncharacterized protein C9orf131 homolog [Orycteropus afer afer]|uniref:Uncharacterized protein C9orf131 homolog n=1 Tax=Orycteropus afer afer TaxID=1230840 RepID=A0A8B7ACN9_ORYAF|nr:uncharacterized protein C9orf131 homolog [Orycteropus afer afer]
MELLPEGLFRAVGDMGLLWGQVANVLACRHCGNSCLQSPGNLMTLFLFIVWQIRRWRQQLGKWPQLQLWCSWDMMQSKGLSLLSHVAFPGRPWKQKSEEEEEEEEEEEAAPAGPLKPYSPLREVPSGEQSTLTTPQPVWGSEAFPTSSRTPEQISTQPLNPSRSFPTFQILTNLPVRHTTASGSHVEQRKSLFFWGPPSLHSELLEATYLCSGGPSSLHLSASPSIFFNKLSLLPKPNLLLPQHYPQTQLPSPQVHTVEDLEGLAPGSQPPSPAVLSLALLHPPMTEPQETSALGDPPGYETQQRTTKQKESRQASEPPMPAPCQAPDSLSEPQKVNPKGSLSSPKAFWGTLGQRENPQASECPVPVRCLPPAPGPELRGGVTLGNPSGYEASSGCRENSGNPWVVEPTEFDLNPCSVPLPGNHETSLACFPLGSEAPWKDVKRRENLRVSEDPVSPPHPPSSLLESTGMEPQGVLPESEALWETMGNRDNLWACKSPAPAGSLPLAPLLETDRMNSVGGLPGLEAAWKDTGPPSLVLSPPPTPVLESFGSSPTGALFDPEITCGVMQQRKDSWTSELPAGSLDQDPRGASPQGILSDAGLVREVVEHEESCCASAPPVRKPSTAPNSVSKSHRIAATGDQRVSTPEGLVEQREDPWATELLALAHSSLSAPPAGLHTAPECVWRNVRGVASQASSPRAGDPLQPVLGLPTLAEALKTKPSQPDPLQGEGAPEAKAETPPSWDKAVPERPTHLVQAWHWSRALERRLKDLQQSSASSSPGQRRPLGSSPAPSPPTPGSWEYSSCPPQQTRPPNPCPCSSSCHFQEAQGTAPQPISHCQHPQSIAQPQSPGSGRTRQNSQREQSMKRNMVARVASQEPGVYLAAGNKCPSLGAPSNPTVPASDKRQNKASAKNTEHPKKPRSGDHGGGDAKLRSSRVTGASQLAQAKAPVEGPVGRLSRRILLTKGEDAGGKLVRSHFLQDFTFRRGP